MSINEIENPGIGRNDEAQEPTIASSTMKISAARELYALYWESFYPDNSNLVRVIRENEVTVPLSNSNYMHALAYTDLMFRNTRTSFRMVSGGHGDGFLSCLQSSFEEMLCRIKSAGGKARIVIVDGSADFLSLLRNKFPGTLEVVEAISEKDANVSHFIVCDEEMVRDEEPHGPLSDDVDANVVKANVYFHNRAVAKAMGLRFDQIWQVVT